jgi:hypothetical protein
MKYTVRVNETQYWQFDFEVEAKSSEEALHLGEALYYEGMQSDDNELVDSHTTGIQIKDAIDKEFFNRITNNLLGETNGLEK